jgi:prepilin-type N-terminal cleavage/methylation domain-containing protein
MRKKGFTLIELMIVISIIGILSMMVVPKLNYFKKEAKSEQLRANVVTVKNFLNERKEPNINKGVETGNAIYDMIDSWPISDWLKWIFKLLFGGSGNTTYNINLYVKSPNAMSSQTRDFFVSTYTGSRVMNNPYTDSDVVSFAGELRNSSSYYTNSILSNQNIQAAALVFYVDGTFTNDNTIFNSNIILPQNENSSVYFNKFSNADLRKHVGKVIIIVHYDGYVGFGVGENGEIIDPFVIKFANIKDFGINGIKPSPVTDIEVVQMDVEDYLFDRVKQDIIYLQTANGNDEKNLMDYLYNNFPTSVDKDFPDRYGIGSTQLVTNSAWKKIDSSKTFLLFEQDQHFDKGDPSKYKNSICIIPNLLTPPYGYVMYIIDVDGKISAPIYVY